MLGNDSLSYAIVAVEPRYLDDVSKKLVTILAFKRYMKYTHKLNY
jgi:hypothetical protein